MAMRILETEQEKKSLVITLVSFGVFLLVFFLLKFSDTITTLPELEGGGGGGDVAVNFGDSEFGMGENYDSKETFVSSSKQTPQEPADEKEILVSDNEDAPAAAEVKKPTEKPKKPEEPKPIVKPQPKPSKSTSDALNSLLGGNDQSGDGNDNVGGNKGKAYGNTSDRGYNGGGGSGTGSGGGNGSGQGTGSGSGYGSGIGGGRGSGVGNYQLAGRKPLTKPAPRYECNEEGQVAVRITVDRNGNVISAIAGDRGTTNRAQCLAQQAEIAAKNTRWEANPSAPEKQVGKIIYNFKLTD